MKPEVVHLADYVTSYMNDYVRDHESFQHHATSGWKNLKTAGGNTAPSYQHDSYLFKGNQLVLYTQITGTAAKPHILIANRSHRKLAHEFLSSLEGKKEMVLGGGIVSPEILDTYVKDTELVDVVSRLSRTEIGALSTYNS